ncbi:uncharacterized protein LOC119452416 [Dermacentor silvarum]|uniref:uncharacterized protein LOC119452416 n=1 Tax=Dermacentor silvarum TaxID=543639 RepID=UPI00189A10D1|nr:uncharacterized protein LOC119452416 [Dermacentor silvarum]
MGQLMSCCGCKCCSHTRERLRSRLRRLFESPQRPEQVPEKQSPVLQPQQQPDQQQGPEQDAATAEKSTSPPFVPGTAVQSPSDSEAGVTSSLGDTTDTEGRLSTVLSPTGSSLTVISPMTTSSDSREGAPPQEGGSSSGLSSTTPESDAHLSGNTAAGTVKTPP